MKKTMLFICCLFPLISMAQDKKTMIKGTAEFKVPTTIYAIFYSKATQTKTIDSAEVKDGKFQLPAPYSGLAVSVMMYAGHNHKGLQQVDPHDVKAFLVDKDGSAIHIKESMRTAILSDNHLEKEKENYIKYMYIPEADSAKMGFYINGSSPIIFSIQGGTVDTSSAEKLDQYNKIRATIKKMDGFIQQKLDYQRKYVKAYPDSYFSLPALEDIARYGNNLDEAGLLFNGLSARLRNSPDAAPTLSIIKKAKEDKLHPEKTAQQMAASMPAKPAAIGSMAPDFTQFDVNGKTVKLSDFKGKYVLLDFWASWCIPCRKENPNLIKAYHQFKDKNLSIVGVALEEKGNKEAWLAAIKKDELPWLQLAEIQNADNTAAKAYGVNSIPMNFLIDPSGKIIASNLRGPGLLDKLSEIFSN